MTPRRCQVCSATIASTAPATKVYCSGACRTKAYERRRRDGESPAQSRATASSAVAEVVPISTEDRLDEALARALDPRRLLGIVASHAGARQPTSWRAALAWLHLGGASIEPAGENVVADDVWARVDELAAKRAGTSVAELRLRGRRARSR